MRCERLAYWVNFDTEGGDVFLLELSSQVTLDEGGFSGTAVADKHELECRWALNFCHCDCLLREEKKGVVLGDS